MSSTPLSRRGLLGLFAALLGWCRWGKAAPSALSPPTKGRIYRTLFCFETTVRGDQRTTRVTPRGPTLEVTDELPMAEPPATWTGTLSFDERARTVSTYTFDSALNNHFRMEVANVTTTTCYDADGEPTAFIYPADGIRDASSCAGEPGPRSNDRGSDQAETIGVTLEYRYGLITFPER
jgi:hypothetical protein